MPPDLHAQLAQAAEREGSSLNGYITARLRESVDGDPAHAQAPSEGSSNARLTRFLLVNSAAVAFAAAVALVILLVAWLG